MKELQVYDKGSAALSVDTVREQVRAIQELMQEILKPDVHYGVIPGTPKPTLYKPGAEKIGMMFGLTPEFSFDRHEEEGGHREYEVTCKLVHRATGTLIAEGVGTCSTLESKYRYRNEVTKNEVPKEYWKHRDPELLGGREFGTVKRDGTWYICHRVEYANPADYYNTVKKMAAKRAHVAAILLATAAGDIFDQDLDDLPADGHGRSDDDNPEERPAIGDPEEKPKAQARKKKATPKAKPKPKPQKKDHNEWTGKVKSTDKVGEGKRKDGSPWRLYKIGCEQAMKFKTFEDDYADVAASAYAEDMKIHVTYSKDDRDENLIESIELV